MDEVGTFEAKNKWSELLARAERGEEILITKRGRPVAKLGPVDGPRDRERGRAAMARIRALAKELNFGPFDWEEWKKCRDEGRE
jgi:prevent-host-death family protein